MSYNVRVGIHIGPVDPFWVQVREGVYDKAQQLPIDFIPIDVLIDKHPVVTKHNYANFVDELLAQDLDALITSGFSEELYPFILERNLPIISLVEADLEHPRFISVKGLYDI